MSWLRSLFAKADEITRLQTERDDHISRISELKRELKASEAERFNEISANREYEAALVVQIVKIAGGDERDMPIRRRKLATHRFTPEDDDTVFEDGHIAEKPDAEFERQVEARAKEFAEVAKVSKGIVYDEMAMEVLKEKIRQNPSEYLAN